MAARVDARGECPECGGPVDAAAALAGDVAAADVDVHGWAVAVESGFEEPVGRRGPGCDAALSFGLASFFGGDPVAGAFEVGDLDAFEEAQHVEPGQLFAHAFDSMITSARQHPEGSIVDDQTDQLLDEVRDLAASIGLTPRPVSTEEFLEMGRRAQLSRGRRFHITRSATGSPLASGWWADEDAARARFRVLVASFGWRPGAVIALVDEAERRTLAVWPEAS